MRFTVGFGLVAALALSAEAPPPRPVHLDIATAQSRDILVQCIEKKLTALPVKEVPLDGGGSACSSRSRTTGFTALRWNIGTSFRGTA